MFVGTAGFLVTLITGLAISFMTGHQSPKELKPGLYVKWLPWIPKNEDTEPKPSEMK